MQLIDPLATKPDFTSKFPSRENADRDAILCRVQQYFCSAWPWPSQRYKAKYVGEGLEEWSLKLAAVGPEDRVILFCKYITCFFLSDDILENQDHDTATRTASRMLRILKGDHQSLKNLTPTELVLCGICNEIRKIGSGEHIFAATCAYLEAAGAKNEREQSAACNFDQYLEYRLKEVGGWLTFEAAFWSREIVIPEALRVDPKFYELQLIGVTQATLVNDLYSYRKEKKAQDNKKDSSGEITYNSMAILMERHRLTPVQALEDMKKRIREHEDRFTEVLDDLKRCYQSSPVELKVIEDVSSAVVDIMGGNYIWSTYCKRYNQ